MIELPIYLLSNVALATRNRFSSELVHLHELSSKIAVGSVHRVNLHMDYWISTALSNEIEFEVELKAGTAHAVCSHIFI